MPVKFSVNKDSLDRVVVPQGLYTLEVLSFRPKAAKKTESGHNLNVQMQVIDRVGDSDPELASKKVMVFDSLNTAFGVGIQDFCHACGHNLDDDGNIPGEFDGPTEDKLKYNGPLLGARLQAELDIREYNGQLQNAIKSYVCAVENCASVNPKVRHSKNLIKSS